MFFFVTSKSQFRRHAQKLKVKYFGGPLESFFFFTIVFILFHEDGYHSSIVWLNTIQIYVSIKVDITTIFDSQALYKMALQ